MDNISYGNNGYIDKIQYEVENDLIPNFDKYVSEQKFKEKMKTVELALLENSAKIDGDLGKFKNLAEKFVRKISKYPNYEETHDTIKSIKLGQHGHVIQGIYLKLNPNRTEDSDVQFHWRETLLDEFQDDINLNNKKLSFLFKLNEITEDLENAKLLGSIKKNYPHPLKSKSPQEYKKSLQSFISLIDNSLEKVNSKETKSYLNKMKEDLINSSEKINDYFSQ